MVIKTSKLRPRQRRYSSDSESPVEFSASSDESLPAPIPRSITTQKPIATKPNSDHGLFKSPPTCGSTKLAVNKNKIVRTYGTKFVPWMSIASSTPIAEKSMHLKHTPLSPIGVNPSPAESSFEDKEQEDSNWYTCTTEEEKKSKESPSKRLRKSPRKNSPASVGQKLNVSHVEIASQEVAKVIRETSVKLVEIVHEKTYSRDSRSGDNHHSGVVRHAEHLVPSKHGSSRSLNASHAAKVTTVKQATPRKERGNNHLNASRVGSASQEVAKVIREANVKLIESVRDKTYSRDPGSGDKHHSGVVRHAEHLVLSRHGSSHSLNASNAANETTVEQATPCKEGGSNNLNGVVNTPTDVLRETSNRESNIPVECMAKSPVGTKVGRSTSCEVSESATIASERQAENGNDDNIQSPRSSPKKTGLRGSNNPQASVELAIGVEPEITTPGVVTPQNSLKKLHRTVTLPVEEPVEDASALASAGSPPRRNKKRKVSEQTGEKQAAVDTVRSKRPSRDTHAEDADTGIRRSKRQRVAPLRYWKGERIQYEPIYHPECKIMYKMVGIIRPRIEDTSNKKVRSVPRDNLRKEDKNVKKTHTKKIDKNTHSSSSSSIQTEDDMKEKIPMKLSKEMEDVECVSHFCKTAFEPFVLDSGQYVDGVQYQTCLSLSGFTNGLLKIASGAGHQEELNEVVDLLLFVAKGKVDVMINGHTVHARPGSSVIIPKGVLYKITNDSTSEALLSYVTKN